MVPAKELDGSPKKKNPGPEICPNFGGSLYFLCFLLISSAQHAIFLPREIRKKAHTRLLKAYQRAQKLGRETIKWRRWTRYKAVALAPYRAKTTRRDQGCIAACASILGLTRGERERGRIYDAATLHLFENLTCRGLRRGRAASEDVSGDILRPRKNYAYWQARLDKG